MPPGESDEEFLEDAVIGNTPVDAPEVGLPGQDAAAEARQQAQPPTAAGRWWSGQAEQQPDWGDAWLVERVRSHLARLPPLVAVEEIDALRGLLAEVAAGRMRVVQAGDCAEDPADCGPEALEAKAALLAEAGAVMAGSCGVRVVTVGRIAGQFAKPRSRPHDEHDGRRLPAYRGPMVNGPELQEDSRRPDPLRMLACHRAAADAVAYLRRRPGGPTVWTSHEALILDYEAPQLRIDGDGRLLLRSTHWPWIGERTRDVTGAHVGLLAGVANPVACKVGPSMRPPELVELCARLDPGREPGRLTLITRLGAEAVAEVLPGLVDAVAAAGHPVIWLCDPMHGNTIVAPDGRKTRLLDSMIAEVRTFQAVVVARGGTAGGLHLETTPDPVDECVADATALRLVGSRRYTTLCDPRLNREQTLTMAGVWTT